MVELTRVYNVQTWLRTIITNLGGYKNVGTPELSKFLVKFDRESNSHEEHLNVEKHPHTKTGSN